MFNKKFVNADSIQASKDQIAQDRLKRLRELHKQYDTVSSPFAGPAVPRIPEAPPRKPSDNDSESEIDEEELKNMKVPSSSEDDEDKWAEKPVATSSSKAPSAALLSEDKHLTSLLEVSSSFREKKLRTKGELQKSMAQVGLAVMANSSGSTQLATIDEPGQQPNELNPFWKSSGTGLPEEKQSSSSQSQQLPGTTDARWLKRALLRCEQLAKEQSRDVEEVVGERYGSLEELNRRIEEAERRTRPGMTEEDLGDRGRRDRRSFMNPSRDSRGRKDRDTDNRNPQSRRSEAKFERQRPRQKRSSSSESSDREDKHKRQIQDRDFQSHRKDDRMSGQSANQVTASSLRAQFQFPSRRRQNERDEAREATSKPEPSRMGDSNKEAAAALRAQLFGGSAPPAQSEDGNESKKDTGEAEVVLRTSKTGLAMPFIAGQSSQVASGSRRKLETHSKEGDRLRFLPGEDKMSVTDMIAMEKATDSRQQNQLYMRFSGKEKFNDDFDVDDAYVEKASKRRTIEKHEAAERKHAVSEHRKTSKALASCSFCIERAAKHLIVAFGERSYLAVPTELNLVPDHCQIIPRDHVRSITQLEEDVWEEVQLFKKSVFRMFNDKEMDVVFIETCMPSKNLGHAVIECFPLEEEAAEMAPIFFKKALLDSEGMWSDNKKVIDLKGGNIRKTVPSGFAYFAVEFGIGGQGFAHIIENEGKFPAYFGKEVIGGIIDCEPSLWRRPKKDSIENQLDKACRLQRLYSKYDWTSSLSIGSTGATVAAGPSSSSQ